MHVTYCCHSCLCIRTMKKTTCQISKLSFFVGWIDNRRIIFLVIVSFYFAFSPIGFIFVSGVSQIK